MKEARDAGNWYRISLPGKGEYAPPACENPEEVLACAKELFNIAPGTVFNVERIYGGEIGCFIVEDCGTITA